MQAGPTPTHSMKAMVIAKPKSSGTKPKEACLAWERALGGRCISISELSGTTKGRKDSEWGAMGVRRVPGTEGATMGPPADML